MSDFLPTASLETLRRRAALLRTTRQFFDAAGYLEVDTPLLSADVVIDAWIEPIVAEWRSDPWTWQSAPGAPRYLQTSPEFAMKRLLAAGATAIYQLGKVFRNGEVGRRHNPEFTMLEWYRVGDDLDAQLQFTEDYVTELAEQVCADRHWPEPARQAVLNSGFRRGFERLTYEQAFERITGVAVLQEPVTALHDLARSAGLVPPPTLESVDKDGWLNWLLAELIEPQLGRERPTFLYDYPATQSALAKTVTRPDGVAVAKRFELYIHGVELCNGYHELIDPQELRRRNAAQSQARAAVGLRPLPAESRLLEAMDAGLPASAGVALGFDRLLMWLLGTTELRDVIPFPWDRA